MTWHPLVFQPLFMERIWGGRELESRFGKSLPHAGAFGESWEISDRPGAISVVASGPLAGRSLRDLMRDHPAELTGSSKWDRFPLLIKILDAREKLSLQVHPPAAKAAAMGGEPKTEMWHIVHAAPDAELYVGLRRGVSRADFEKKLEAGTVAECFHRVPVQAGDSMFLPSGRVHAIGGGLVIFEVQQNSDTTYRVFDWNRVDAKGKPRELHVAESLACIDFEDFEPPRIPEPLGGGLLVDDPLFKVELHKPADPVRTRWEGGKCRIIAMIAGTMDASAGGVRVPLTAGTFCLLPAALPSVEIEAGAPCRFLEITPGSP